MRREELKEYLQSLGATVQDNVSKDTTALLVGVERGGVKYNKAMKYGTMILPYEQFVALGLASTRSDAIIPEDLESLIRDTLFLMVRIVDSTYAHLLLRRTELLRRAYHSGGEAIDSLLRGTWGGAFGGPFDPGQEPNPPTPESVRRHLRELISFWLGLVTLLAREVESGLPNKPVT